MKLLNTYFPSLSDGLKENCSDLILEELLKIEPLFEYPNDVASSFEIYLNSLKAVIIRVLPPEILEAGRGISSLEDNPAITGFYNQIAAAIPTVSWSTGTGSSPHIVTVTTLCSADYTHGVGRFLGDVYSRWLIPGKQLQLVYVNAMAFRFSLSPDLGFFIHEVFLKIETKKDLQIVQEHMPTLIKEVVLNISAVGHARKIGRASCRERVSSPV